MGAVDFDTVEGCLGVITRNGASVNIPSGDPDAAIQVECMTVTRHGSVLTITTSDQVSTAWKINGVSFARYYFRRLTLAAI